MPSLAAPPEEISSKRQSLIWGRQVRQDVSFVSKGLKCRGWLYMPDDVRADDKVPAIVMAHGFSAVKEQILPEFAQRFVDEGFAVLVFDYRYFGDSEGEPRCQLFPLEMVEDYRNQEPWLSRAANDAAAWFRKHLV